MSFPRTAWPLVLLLCLASARHAAAYEVPARGDLPRRQAATVYDPVRQRVLVIATSEDRRRSLEVWSRAVSDSGAWVRLDVDDQAPAGRIGASAVYDPDGDRVILFGGLANPRFDMPAPLDETWCLALSGRPHWSPLRLVAGSPTPGRRYDHVALLDRARHRMLVAGGLGIAKTQRDGWVLELDGKPRWRRLDADGRAPECFGAAAVIDSRRDRVVMWGGMLPRSSHWALDNGTLVANFETDYASGAWERSLADTGAWQPLECGGDPQARMLEAAAYDSLGDRILAFGGELDGEVRGDLRVLDCATLEWMTVEALPPWPLPRMRALLALEPSLTGRLLVAGGVGLSGERLADCQALRLDAASAWAPVAERPVSPGARHGASLIVDPTRDRLLLFGGTDGNQPHDDLWTRPLGANGPWTALAPAGVPPPAQPGLVAVLDTVRGRLVVLGASDTTGRARAVWTLALGDALRWTRLEPTGLGPAFCRSPAAVLAGHHHVVLSPGGTSEVWALALTDPPAWKPVGTAGPGPGPLVHQSLVYDPLRDRVILFGGEAGSSWSGEVRTHADAWALTLRGLPRWSKLLPDAKVRPSERYRHAAAYDPVGDRMLIVGGARDSKSAGSDVWALRLGEPMKWEQLFGSGVQCGPVLEPAVVYDAARDRLLLYGGHPANEQPVVVPLAPR